MIRKQFTHAIEDYLKAVFELTAKDHRASTTQLSGYLGVTPASVTGMVQKLAATTPPLLKYKKHHGVLLTPEGRQVALEIVRHHRLIEMFLHKTLGFEWDEVHEEADRLEHVISEDLEERIAQALGYPTHDPHGDPIPNRDLELPPSSGIALSDLRPGQRGRVVRVRDSDPALLRYLSDLGIKPATELIVEDYSPFDGNLHIRLNEASDHVVLGPKVTSQVFVELQA